MKPSVSLSFAIAFSLVICEVCTAAGQPPRTQPPTSPQTATSSPEAGTSSDTSQFVIPGPRRSFLRMAGISQKVTPEEVLPLLSRNVFTRGFQGPSHVAEFLILLRRYVVQARELASLASESGMTLRVSNCDDARPLLHILGYRTRPNCGDPSTSLMTEDPERAFLAVDSGFPLSELERTLKGGKPFEYPYVSEPVPVLFAESDWTLLSKKNLKENSRDLLNTILNDSSVARLYWAMSRLDRETAKALEQSIGLQKLLPYGGVLDFYGRELCITDGKVIVPGGQQAAVAWRELVGADPAVPASFVSKLLAKDRGWLAAYFDALSRIGAKQQEYFTDAHRLRLFYSGLRTPDPAAPATRGSFRPAPWLLLLVTRLQFDKSGAPLVPGDLEAWNEILFKGSYANLVRKWARQNGELKDPEQLLKVMFALSRTPTEPNPLQIYMAVSELDRRRLPEHRLAPATVRLLARRFEDFSDQYRIFSEFPELNDQSITLFLQEARGLNTFSPEDRGNALGLLQANVAIWQILARQGEISKSRLNESWQEVLKPFANVRSGIQLYDAGKNSLVQLFKYSTEVSEISQDKLIDLLAGPSQDTPAGRQMHRESAARIRSVLDDQRLVPLDTLITLGNALQAEARGKQTEEYVLLLAAQTREFEMPRPIFSMGEREDWAAGVYNNHHTDLQMKSNLQKVLKSANVSIKQIEEARDQLASFLRDTLVGLSYAYYEPPGAQAVHHNPLLVRSHDFAGETLNGFKHPWQAPEVLGEGTPAGGGAHFVGSLADFPYYLAALEQDFISPNSVQALIWEEITPELLASGILPRWWNVTPAELHAVTLYQRAGEELLTASVNSDEIRSRVLNVLSTRLLRQRSKEIEQELRSGHISEVLSQMMPADTFYLGVDYTEKYSDQLSGGGAAIQELQRLQRMYPEQVSWKRLSHDFGTPHPGMAYNSGLELLNVPAMPAFAGEASRFMAESFDSPNLYWARLVDERGDPPVVLNHLAPELTRAMVEKIFATDFEDWPALLRAMRETGEEFREGKLGSIPRMSQ